MATPGLRPRPFPWGALPRQARADVEAARAARAALAPYLALDRVVSEASVMLRGPVEVRVLGLGVERVQPGLSRVSLEFPGGPGKLWVEAEVSLMLRVAEVVLGLGAGWSDPRQAPAPEIEGAWAAFLVALARRCGVEAPPRLGPPPLPGEFVVVRVAARLGGELFSVRVGVPRAALPPPPRRFDRATLASLGSLPLSLPLVAAQSLAARADLAELIPGAAWAPGPAWTLRPQGGAWSGQGLLVAGDSELGAEVALSALGSPPSLVLTRPSAPASWEPAMPDPTDPNAPEADLADALAEAPVVMRVEVATVTLEAQQWARLGPGDVVATGVKLGEHVTLRAGGAVFARGELCELDGELAVRILHRP